MSLLTLLSSSALAGTITYNGAFFVDNGYNSGTANDGIQNGGETGYTLGNMSFSYTLSDGTNGNTPNSSTNSNGTFSLAISAASGVSLTKLSINSVNDCSSSYTLSGGIPGGTSGTFTAGNNCGFTMTWPTGKVLSGTTVTGSIGMMGNKTINGFVYLNNGNINDATNQTMDASESGFTAFPVAIEVKYSDPKTGQALDFIEYTSTTTGAYPAIQVPQNTGNVTITVEHTQLVNAGYFVDADQTFNGGNYKIGDENCTPTNITGVYGSLTYGYSPCYADLADSWVTTGTINNSLSNISFGVVPFNSLTLLSSSSSQVVPVGGKATYEYKFTSYASDMGLRFALTGGTNPVFYIKEASFQNPDCNQPYDTSSSGNQYQNWNVTIGPGTSVCIEVVDTPTTTSADQVTLYALYQYKVTNNPWTRLSGTTQTATSVTGVPVTGTVFVDDGSGSGTANNGTKDGSETPYSGTTITATYTYMVGSVPTPGTASTTTDATGAFSFLVPTNASNVVITRTAITGALIYTGTGGSGGSSTLKGTYLRGSTAASADTVTIPTLSSTVTGIAFGIVELSTLTPNNAQTTPAGTTLYYLHTFTAYTKGKVTFTISSTKGWASVLSAPTCTGTFVSGPVSISAATTATPSSVCVQVKVVVPGAAAGASIDVTTVSAGYAYLNGATTVVTYPAIATDTTTVAFVPVTLVKSANVSSVNPQSNITYTLQYANLSSSPSSVSSFRITDTVPTNTTFVSASTTFPSGSGLTGCTLTTVPPVGGTGNVVWTFTGVLDPGKSGSVTLTVKVK